MSNLSAQLRATVGRLMGAHGESQEVLADALGLSQGQVSRKQSGASAWNIDDLERLAVHFGITPADLLGDQVTALTRSITVRGKQCPRLPQ